MAFKPIEQWQVDKIREMWSTDATIDAISKVVGVSRSCVSNQATNKLGLPMRMRGSIVVQGEVAARMYHEGQTLEVIGRHFGVSHGTISRMLRQRGIATGHPTVNGDPLTMRCVNLYRVGFTHAEIGKRLGISERKVGHRCRRVLGTGKWGGDRKSHQYAARGTA